MYNEIKDKIIASNIKLSEVVKEVSNTLKDIVISLFIKKGFNTEFCDNIDCYISPEVSMYGTFSLSDILITYKWENLGVTVERFMFMTKEDFFTFIENSESISDSIKMEFGDEYMNQD